MTEEEVRNMEVARLWVDTYNDDVERMVDECYAPDCQVQSMASGEILNGREELRELERAVSKLMPTRRMSLVRAIPAGDTVVMEVTAEGTPTGGEGQSGAAACIVLTFRDGQIVSDHTYALSPMSIADLLKAAAQA
jgi:ketosteroid isomerase-like protein